MFSANLGFLWTELPLVDAIRAAKRAGFDAVECHWPYATPSQEVVDVLLETGLPMLGVNTARGDVVAGDNGLAAVPGRSEEARAGIDEALAYAAAINCPSLHVMAGFAAGAEASECYIANLKYACDKALELGLTILIEPLNPFDAPNYFLSTTAQALEVIAAVGAPNLKIMFDCYHVQRVEGNLSVKLEQLKPYIGHIQFASVPDRGPPNSGEVNFEHIFKHIRALGYTMPLGAEYRPNMPTEQTLGWMSELRV